MVYSAELVGHVYKHDDL